MLKDEDFFETELVEETHYLEEELFVDENLVKNRALIRVDMNIVQFPIFSKNAKRKKNEITTYYFNKNKDTYITIKPTAGDLIPGEAEERIFIALMKIMKEKGMEQEFIVTAKEIRDAAKIHASHYIKDIKKSLLRLSETSYNFKNTMYSNETNTILKEEVSTPILTFKSLLLSSKENKEIKKTIKDNRVKEVYFIRISEHFYKNVVKRGYLVYDSNILLDINGGIARTLYMLLEKIRFDNLYVKESIFALIKKIPLKYEKRSLPTTIKTLEKAFNELKQKKLLKDFKFIKESTWLQADVEIFYAEVHNSLKQERFDEDNKELKNIYNTLAISHTEKNIEEKIDNGSELPIITEEMIQDILDILPKKAQDLKSISKTIFDSIQNYGYKKVKAAAIYLKNQKKLTSPRAYFLKCLENDWAKDIIVEDEKIIEAEIVENKKEDLVDLKEAEKYYNTLTLAEQEELEKKVYLEYIKECGQDTKVQKIAFRGAKNNLILKYIDANNLVNKEVEIITVEVEDTIEKNKVLTDRVAFNDYINESIDMYKIGFDLSEEETLRIKRQIFLQLTGKFILKELTLEEINKTIAEKLGG